MDAEKRRKEQRDFGVFFDDDYDYLQHLKEASGPSELVAAGPSHFNRGASDFRDEEEENEVETVSKDIPVSLCFNFCLSHLELFLVKIN